MFLFHPCFLFSWLMKIFFNGLDLIAIFIIVVILLFAPLLAMAVDSIKDFLFARRYIRKRNRKQ